MSVVEADLAEVELLAPGARLLEEAGMTYVFLPQLRLPEGCLPRVVDALLRPCAGPDGYTSRLYFAAAYPHRGQNWTEHRILDRPWHAFSFNNVPAELRLIEILSNHLSVLR